MIVGHAPSKSWPGDCMSDVNFSFSSTFVLHHLLKDMFCSLSVQHYNIYTTTKYIYNNITLPVC